MNHLKTLRHASALRIILSMAILVVTGCQSTKEFSYLASDPASYHLEKIVSATLKNGEIVTFNAGGGRYATDFHDSTVVERIVGFDVSGKVIQLPLDRILDVQCETKSDNSTGAVLGIVAGTIVLSYLFLGLLLSGFH